MVHFRFSTHHHYPLIIILFASSLLSALPHISHIPTSLLLFFFFSLSLSLTHTHTHTQPLSHTSHITHHYPVSLSHTHTHPPFFLTVFFFFFIYLPSSYSYSFLQFSKCRCPQAGCRRHSECPFGGTAGRRLRLCRS